MIHVVRIILRTLRAEFFPASMIPVALGAVLAFNRTGRWDGGLFAWSLLGVVGLNAAANVANDFFDCRSGNDAINKTYIRPFSGGSRTVQDGLITPRGLIILALCGLAPALVAGVVLLVRTGWPVLWLGCAGMLLGYFYTAPPIRLAARGLGEVAVGLAFGALPTAGSYFVQTGAWSWTPVWMSLTPSILIVAVLVVNQFPDYEADMAVGKNNWVIRLGRRRAAGLYAALMAAWPVALVLTVWPGGAPKPILWALSGLCLAIPATWVLFSHKDHPEKLVPACALTSTLHVGVGLMMCAALLWF